MNINYRNSICDIISDAKNDIKNNLDEYKMNINYKLKKLNAQPHNEHAIKAREVVTYFHCWSRDCMDRKVNIRNRINYAKKPQALMLLKEQECRDIMDNVISYWKHSLKMRKFFKMKNELIVKRMAKRKIQKAVKRWYKWTIAY